MAPPLRFEVQPKARSSNPGFGNKTLGGGGGGGTVIVTEALADLEGSATLVAVTVAVVLTFTVGAV